MNADNTGLVQRVAASHHRVSKTPEAGPIRAQGRSDGKTHAARLAEASAHAVPLAGNCESSNHGQLGDAVPAVGLTTHSSLVEQVGAGAMTGELIRRLNELFDVYGHHESSPSCRHGRRAFPCFLPRSAQETGVTNPYLTLATWPLNITFARMDIAWETHPGARRACSRPPEPTPSGAADPGGDTVDVRPARLIRGSMKPRIVGSRGLQR